MHFAAIATTELQLVPATRTSHRVFAQRAKDRELNTEYDARCPRDLGGDGEVRAALGRRKMEILPGAGGLVPSAGCEEFPHRVAVPARGGPSRKATFALFGRDRP